MDKKSLTNGSKLFVAAISGAVLLLSVLLYLSLSRAPHPPAAIVVSACRDITPGMHRIGSKRLGPLLGIQFDISEKDFTLRSATQDMPPGMLHLAMLKNRSTNMEISNGVALTFEKELDSVFPMLSAHIEERTVRTTSGQEIGKDRWGYLKSGEAWRHVKFFGGDEVGYRPTALKEAKVLDQVISSACLLPASDH